jgi:MscS family membrane protein
MNHYLQQLVFDNRIQDYLWALGIILFAIILNRIISRYLANLLCRLFKRNWKSFDQQKFIDLFINPLGIFLVWTISFIVLYKLNFPKAWNITVYKYSLQSIFHAIGTAIEIAVFIWLLLRIIDFIANVLERRANHTADQSDNQLILFFKDFFKLLLALIGFLLILRFAFNYNITTVLTGLSIVGAAIALSLRESLENLIASFVIFFDKPFTTGDLVKVQNITGNVERIGLRSTRIRTEQKSYVTVPNKLMVDSILDNLSLRSQRKNDLWLHLNLQTPSEKINIVLAELKDHLSKIPDLQSWNVLVEDINQHGIILHLEFFTLPIELSLFFSIKQSVNLFSLQLLENHDIKIAGAMAPGPPPPDKV